MKNKLTSITGRAFGTLAAQLASATQPALLLGVLLAAGGLRAATPVPPATPPSGEYAANFSGDVSLWDVSGTYYETVADEFHTEYTIYQDANGYFTGAGYFEIDIHGFFMDGDIDISGRITGSGKSTRITMKLLLAGGGYTDEATVNVKATATASAEINRALREMVGRMRVNVCVVGSNSERTVRRCAGASESFYAEISDPSMDGSFNVRVNVATTGTIIAGDGRVTLSNGEQFNYLVTGTFNTRRNISSLLLKSAETNGTKTVSLKNATVSGSGFSAGQLNGSAAGQRIVSRNLAQP